MESNEYQEKAMTTCMPSSKNFSYMALNLMGEFGEFCDKVAEGADTEEVQQEAGDIAWQIAGLAWVMGWSLEQIACQNIYDEKTFNYSYYEHRLAGAIGKLQGRVGKAIRKEEAFIGYGMKYNDLYIITEGVQPSPLVEDIKQALRDVYRFYVLMLSAMQLDLNETLQKNLDKLASRKKRGVIDGNGDNR